MSEIQAKYWTTIACDSRKAGAPSLLNNIIERNLRQLQKNELRNRKRPVGFFCHVKGCKPFSFYF